VEDFEANDPDIKLDIQIRHAHRLAAALGHGDVSRRLPGACVRHPDELRQSPRVLSDACRLLMVLA